MILKTQYSVLNFICLKAVLARPVASKFQRRWKQLSIERTLSVLGKTNPKQSHSKPFFQRPIFVLSPKMGIFEDFRHTFLCKTKPFYENFRLSMSCQKRLNMQNEPNLNISLTCLTNEAKRTYSDFCQKDVEKTKPILTFP